MWPEYTTMTVLEKKKLLHHQWAKCILFCPLYGASINFHEFPIWWLLLQWYGRQILAQNKLIKMAEPKYQSLEFKSWRQYNLSIELLLMCESKIIYYRSWQREWSMALLSSQFIQHFLSLLFCSWANLSVLLIISPLFSALHISTTDLCRIYTNTP